MDREDDLLRENRALRERLRRLTEASVRINESLDFDTVLQEVVDNARTLTGSRYGGMAVFDDAGALPSFVTSGFGAEEREGLFNLAEGEAMFGQLRQLSEPLRVRDFQGYLASLGFVGVRFPMQVGEVFPLLAVSIPDGEGSAGNIYLAEKETGDEFTADDEETLVMLASQAAHVIANARKHQEEQRIRADLEALIDTSPVGVAVLDARTGAPVSFNREATRIVDGLREPDQAAEQLLKVLSFRRADGQEISLAELPMSDLLRAGETLRAEEIVLHVPDGRSVAVLLNATPVRSGGGEVESFVVTIQDMTPLDELERLRAEFLAMVSHELRTPLATIRGSVSTLLDDSVQVHPVEVSQFHRIIHKQTDRMRALIADLLDVARIQTGTLPVSPGPTDLVAVANDAVDAFRASGNTHDLRIEIPPDLPFVMADRSRILQVLGNLLTNAARHSPEFSTIRVSAAPSDIHVSVSVSDEGRGIPAESLPHLFRKFSRIEGDEQGGDTGLGLAVCKGIVEAHGGRIWAESDGPGLGARVTFTLPTVDATGFVVPAPTPELSTDLGRGVDRQEVRILAVDDDPHALRYIRDALVKSGYTAIATGHPGEVPGLIEQQKPHLVLLDLMLPGIDGVDLMQEIRDTRDVPVIFVSAYGQDRLVARAFEMGADDYVVKPFSPTELVARIKAVLRRRSTPEPSMPYATGELRIDYAERLVTLRGVPLDVTAMEYRVLVELSTNAGRVVTYGQLLRRVWDTGEDGDVRPIRTVVSALRRKLGDDTDNPTYILTELRVGYKMPRADTPG